MTTITAYITRDALTKGIRTLEVNVEHGRPEDVYAIFAKENGKTVLFETGEWHSDEASAITAAERMRDERIKQLEVELVETKAISFRPKKIREHTRDPKEMTVEEIDTELSELDRRWDELSAALAEEGGRSGSPGEWMVERMDWLETEKKRREA